MIVSIDFETRSKVDITSYGLDKYARDPSTEVLCMAYSIDGGPVELYTPDQTIPQFMYQNDVTFYAWNAAFEYNIMKHVLQLPVKWEQFVDSMAIAAANNLPQGLEDCAIALDSEYKKDPKGAQMPSQRCRTEDSHCMKALLRWQYPGWTWAKWR